MEVEDKDFAIDPEQAAIWNDDTEIDFNTLRPEADSDITPEQPDEVIEDDEIFTPDKSLEQPESPDSTEDDDITDAIPEDEPSKEDNSDTEIEEVKPGTYKVKANGMDFDFTAEELQKLAPKALDYTKKLQEIAPWRKTISALKEQNLGEDDVNLMIDVLKGNKDAIAEVLKRTGVEALDVELSDTPYKPVEYGKPEGVQRIEEIVTQISADPEYRITEQVIDSQWDSASRSIIAKNPDMIMGLHQDVKNGIYDKVAPIAFKMKAMGIGTADMSDLDYYVAAGKEYFSNQENTQVLAQQESRQTREANIQDMAPKRKAAAPSRTSSNKRDVIDYLTDDDESFDDWYKDLMSKS